MWWYSQSDCEHLVLLLLLFFEHNRAQSGKKMVTGMQEITASQVRSIRCRWQANFVLPITSRSTSGTNFDKEKPTNYTHAA